MSAIITGRQNALEKSGVDSGKRIDTGQYLTFVLTGEIYALGILHIKEIIQYGDLTEVPMMPSFIRGVIN